MNVDNWCREYKRGKYHCTIDLPFDWSGLVCLANKDKNCQLSHSWFQTSQTGGQWYSDTSPFSIPCLVSLSSYTFSSLLTLWENKLGRFYHKLPEKNAPAYFAPPTLKIVLKYCQYFKTFIFRKWWRNKLS